MTTKEKAFKEIWTEEWEKMRTPVALLTRQSPTGYHPEGMHAAVSAPAATPYLAASDRGRTAARVSVTVQHTHSSASRGAGTAASPGSQVSADLQRWCVRRPRRNRQRGRHLSRALHLSGGAAPAGIDCGQVYARPERSVSAPPRANFDVSSHVEIDSEHSGLRGCEAFGSVQLGLPARQTALWRGPGFR